MPARLLTAILLFSAASSVRGPGAAPLLVVVVSPSRPEGFTNISMSDLRQIYLGRITRWPDGRRIVPVVLPLAAAEQRLFLKRVPQMADIDYAQHWISQIFRGRVAGPPFTSPSSADARRFVTTHPDAIAFIDAAEADGTVRILTINGKSAGPTDYPLAP